MNLNDLKDLDLTSCRLAGSDCLSDEIMLPLQRALAVIELQTTDNVTAIIEYEIRHARQVAEMCQCRVKGGES